jgi:DNA-binding transcriptional LysR family regulator
MSKSGWSELNAVVAIASHLNFRAAAVELGMSPSALSHTITALEQRMGVRLFNRTTRSVSMTAAGEQFLARIGPALREIAGAMEAAHELAETPTGTLRINTSDAAARKILTPIILRYLARYPAMRVDVVCDGLLIDIVAGGFDAGIRLAESVPQDMVSIPCSPPARFVVVGSPAYLARHGVPQVPGDLLAHECIRGKLPSGAPLRWEFEKHGESVMVDVTGRLTLGGGDLWVDAALGDAGLAYISEWSATEPLRDGRLLRVLEDWTPSFPGLCLYYAGHRHVPAALQALVAIIREQNVLDREVGGFSPL